MKSTCPPKTMEEQYTKSTRINRKRNALKEDAKIKRLQKEQERANRPSSCRLGKNQKKQTARKNIILDEQIERTEELEEPPHSDRIILRRQRRKQSHRPAEKTRISETSHLHDLEAYDPKYPYYIPDDGFDWGRMMAEVSERAHQRRRERERIEKEFALLYERKLQQSERNLARALRANYPVGPFRY